MLHPEVDTFLKALTKDPHFRKVLEEFVKDYLDVEVDAKENDWDPWPDWGRILLWLDPHELLERDVLPKSPQLKALFTPTVSEALSDPEAATSKAIQQTFEKALPDHDAESILSHYLVYLERAYPLEDVHLRLQTTKHIHFPGSLRSAMIKLAQVRPELRRHLVPLLRRGGN